MSHGGLNILGKKSWNVWNRDNREKVKKDEEAFAQQEEKKRRRLEEIEQEKRFHSLKTRVAEVKKQNQDLEYDEILAREKSDAAAKIPQHINFFEESELSSKVSSTNPEAEAEKKNKEEAELKKIGALMYLGQDSKVKPWYSDPVVATEARQKRDEKRKQTEDPMRDMNRYLAQQSAAAPAFVPPAPLRKPAPRTETSIEKLRRERLEREKKEREKAQQLVTGVAPRPPSQSEASRPYNNQFSHFTNAKSRR